MKSAEYLNRENLHNITEIINPKNLPEAAFQSYEMLANDAVAKKADFLAGNSQNPDLEYSKLHDLSSMDKGILRLADVIEQLDHLVLSEEVRDVIASSLGYRLSEMEYIKLLGRLDYVRHECADQELEKELTEAVIEASEALYGKPKSSVRDAALNEIWMNLDGKSWQGKSRQLYDDLRQGFVSAEGFVVTPMRRSDSSEVRLPIFDDSTAWAGAHFEEKNADIEALLQQYWDEKVAIYGDSYTCSPEDIVEAFSMVINMRDPEDCAGVRVVEAEGKTALSWESGQMAIIVGMNRVHIPTSSMLFTRNVHEYGHHGQKAVNGLKTDIPVLGLGLYTDTPDPDYLTFEEGYATIIESAMDGGQPTWLGGGMDYYLGIAFAAEGDDFRSIFEKTWRYNLLQSVDETIEITDEMIEKVRSAAYTSCVRIFRGNPTNSRGDQPVPTYNKDLAYLAGKVKAMEYIREAYEAKDGSLLDFAMLGKFDPTNPVQSRIAREAFQRAGML